MFIVDHLPKLICSYVIGTLLSTWICRHEIFSSPIMVWNQQVTSLVKMRSWGSFSAWFFKIWCEKSRKNLSKQSAWTKRSKHLRSKLSCVSSSFFMASSRWFPFFSIFHSSLIGEWGPHLWPFHHCVQSRITLLSSHWESGRNRWCRSISDF